LASPPLVDLLFERAGVGLCFVAPDDRVLRANAEWLRGTGLRLEQVIGGNIHDLFPGSRECGRAVEQARAGQTIRVPPRSCQLAGQETWWEGTFSPVPMAGGTGILITARDVTEEMVAQRRAEAAKADAEVRAEAERELALARLRAVIDEMPAVVYIADASGKSVLVNRKLDQACGGGTREGMALEEFKGRWEPHRLDGRPVSFEEWPLVRSLKNGESIDREEFAFRVNGRPAFISISSTPLVGQDGQIEGGVAVAWDVTEQKNIERKLREATATLEEANRHKDEFVAMLAHELRNPLAAMKGAAHLTRLRLAKGESVDRQLAVLERQIENSSRLLDDLLDVSRITRQMVQLKKETIRLDAVIGSAVDSQQAVLERARHQLCVSLPKEPVLLEADPTRVEQIVSNLLNNAAKYTPDGGWIELSAEREGKDVVIRVKDNGAGLPPELLCRAFDLFVQADHSLARNKGGLGLGLTLVRRLAEMHGGSVEARSEGPGRGSEFVVRLPARADLGLPTPAPVPAPGCTKTHRRILLVEDNADTAELMAEHLMMLGHTVTVAHDGPSGLAAAERVHPEIALLDIGLPGLDGYEVATRLRGGDAPVLVALSGYGQEEYKLRAQEAGFRRHLTKPVDPDALERLIDELC
jgi:PAS domain S-box-containing protein